MKILVLLTCFAVLGVFTNGQGKNQKPVLKLSLTVKQEKFCFGNTAEITATLTNISKNSVVVDLRRIGVIKNFNDNSKNAGLLIDGPLIVGRHYKPDFKILESNESHTKNLQFVFKNDFFKSSRKYSMQIGYEQFQDEKFESLDVWQGTIYSNERDIFIKKCD